MPDIQFLSTTMVETWKDADLSKIGPIYPMVGSEFVLVIIAFVFWIGFHLAQLGVERRELEADEQAAKSPERLNRVFADEAKGG